MAIASQNNRISVAAAFSLASSALLIAALPAIVYAIARGLVYGHYFELGLYRTAFLNSTTAVGRYAVVVPVVLLVVLAAQVTSAWLPDHARAIQPVHKFMAVLVLGLLGFTGYQLNRAPWYPDYPASGFLYCNGALVVVFVLVGLLVYKPREGLLSYVGFVLVGSLLLIRFGCFHYLHSHTPAMFVDVSDDVGLTEINSSIGVGWADYDNDGRLDLFVSDHLPITSPSYLYHNGGGKFAPPKVIASGDLHGAAWGDYDNDGAADLFVAGGNNTPDGPEFANLLFHNHEGVLENVAARAGVEDTAGRAYGGTWADYDGDGLLDLFVVNYYTSVALFHNRGDGTFENVAQRTGLSDKGPGEATGSGTLCASWADYDNDGHIDLLTVGLETGISLYHNNGDGTFTDVARRAGLVVDGKLGTEKDPVGPAGCAWADYDNDGNSDVYVVTRAGQSGDRNLLFRNKGDGTFAEVGAKAGVDVAAYGLAALWGDFDNDGNLDLYVINGVDEGRTGKDPYAWNVLFLNAGDGTFVRQPSDAAGAAGFPFVLETTGAVADYDNDGFLDIYVNDERAFPEDSLRNNYLRRNLLLRNQGNDNHWLELRLRGTVSNRDGIGAKVYVEAGGKRQFRDTGSRSHIFGQDSPVVHFGLGAAASADSVTIKWPSGITQTLTAVASNRIMTVTEPAKP
jgi:enediyne biosynthesis protein E4